MASTNLNCAHYNCLRLVRSIGFRFRVRRNRLGDLSCEFNPA